MPYGFDPDAILGYGAQQEDPVARALRMGSMPAAPQSELAAAPVDLPVVSAEPAALPAFLREDGPAAFYQRPDGSEITVPSAVARQYRPGDFAQGSGAAPAVVAPPQAPEQPAAQTAAAAPQGSPAPAAQAAPARQPRDEFEAANMQAMAGLDKREQATQQLAAADSAQAQQEAQALQERETRLQGIEAARQKQVEIEQKKLADLTSDTERTVNAYADAKIDKGREWRSLGTGRQILAGIAVALSGFGSALKGQGDKNPALDSIMAAIDKDIKLQMADIDKLGSNVQMKRGQVDQFMKTMGSSEAAYSAAMAGYLARTQRQIELIGAKSKDAQVQARANDFAGQIAEKRAEYLNAAGGARYQREMEAERLAEQKRANRAGEANARASLQLRRDEMAEEKAARAAAAAAQGKAKEAELIRENGVMLPGGGGIILARRPEEAGKITAKFTAAEQMVNLVDRINQARAEHGKEGFGEWLRTEDGKRMTADWGYLFMQTKDYFGLGAIQGADEKLLERVQGEDPSAAWLSTGPILEQLRTNVVQGTNLAIRNNDLGRSLPKDYRWDPQVPKAPGETEQGRIASAVSTREPGDTSGYRETYIRQNEQRGMSREAAERDADAAIRRSVPWKANLDKVANDISSARTAAEAQRKLLALKATAAKEKNPERKAEIQRVIGSLESGGLAPAAPVF